MKGISRCMLFLAARIVVTLAFSNLHRLLTMTRRTDR
jgi:hypothetical protein